MNGLFHTTPVNYAPKPNVNIYLGNGYGGVSSGNITESKTAWLGIAVVAALGAIWCSQALPIGSAVIIITGLTVISLIALSKIFFDISDESMYFKTDRGGFWDWFPRDSDREVQHQVMPPPLSFPPQPIRGSHRRRSLPHIEMRIPPYEPRRAPERWEQPAYGLGIDGKPLARMIPRIE